MKYEIRHRLLYAFYKSKVLNSMMIAVIVGLLLACYYPSSLLPIICSSLALAMFIGYSLWLWIKKPKRIVINDWLSEMSGYFTLYFLIVVALRSDNQWWYIFPAACSVVVLFIALVRNRDEIFGIS